MYSTTTTMQTPWPRGFPRCFARAGLGRALQSIENLLYYDSDERHDVSRSGLSIPLRCSTSLSLSTPDSGRHQVKAGSQGSHKVVLAVWRNPSTGTFLASEDEQTTCCDTLQWTYSLTLANVTVVTLLYWKIVEKWVEIRG